LVRICDSNNRYQSFQKAGTVITAPTLFAQRFDIRNERAKGFDVKISLFFAERGKKLGHFAPSRGKIPRAAAVFYFSVISGDAKMDHFPFSGTNGHLRPLALK